MRVDVFPYIKPLLFKMDPEKAHNFTIKALKYGLSSHFGSSYEHASLKISVFGLSFDNPIGLAAGFDKNAEVIQAIHKLGFGFTEAGTVTPKPQDGNEKPRLFRLIEDRAVINRFGFNNKGLASFAEKLRHIKPGGKPFGANVGANKDTEDKAADYVIGIQSLYGLADYFTVNISSPNTPGLRALQSRAALADLLSRVIEARDDKIAQGAPYVPILVKIAPDLTEEDMHDIAELSVSLNIDGLIVSNTTITRPATLADSQKQEIGGLSGAPLLDLSTKVLAKIYTATNGTIPLVGVGGVQSGADAYKKIRAGASLVQLYSALVYEGPGLVDRIKKDLTELLLRDGFASVSAAVGADHK